MMSVMSFSRLSLLFIVGALASGCSVFETSNRDRSDSSVELLDSEKLTIAVGDRDLKSSIEQDPDSESSDKSPRTELDDAIEPSLKLTAENARDKLDEPEQKEPGEEVKTPDLWQRLRSGFELDHDDSDPRVKAQLDWYKKHPSYIDRVVKRGSRYLHYIITETEKRDLPTELALLPIVESAFDPFAYSHGRAAGLWQFIPSTGKYFGLTQSWWHDDRRDVIAATDAALTYLDQLAKRFDGDYMLGLAAYNSGGGTVSIAMRRNRNKNAATDYWSLALPTETRHYVPKLIALAKIFDDPAKYGIVLPPLKDEPYFEIVETGSQIDLAQAAELAGVDIDEIYLLNPSFNRWATSPDGPHRLLIPKKNAETFTAALEGIDPDDRVAWRNYKVVSGDTLSTIAKRHDTTPSVIQQVNNLDTHIIRIGQRLMIPSSAKKSDTYALSANERLTRKQNGSGKKGNGTRVDYTVRSGDTFWDIAREHRVSVRQVAAWNGMAPGDPLIPGKKLVVWSKSSQPAMLANNDRGKGMVRKVGYQVRKGDSLSTIASRFAVNVRDIASWNDLSTSRYLQPGQSLVLYVDIRNNP